MAVPQTVPPPAGAAFGASPAATSAAGGGLSGTTQFQQQQQHQAGGVNPISNAATTTPGVGDATTAGRYDFGSLLASSSSLLSSTRRGPGAGGVEDAPLAGAGGATGTAPPPPSVVVGGTSAAPALKKSLRELGVASSSLGLGQTGQRSGVPAVTTAATAAAATEAGAHRLLAREGGGFDAVGLGRSARELGYRLSSSASAAGAAGPAAAAAQVKPPGGATADRSGVGGMGGGGPPMSLDAFLNKQLDGIVRGAIESSVADADAASSRLIRARQMEEYERDRRQVLAELAGYRIVEAPPPSRDETMTMEGPAAARDGPPLTFGGATVGGGGGGSRLSESSRRHAALVTTLNARQRSEANAYSPSPPGASGALLVDETASDLLALSRDLATLDSRTSRADSSAAYANACALVRSLASSSMGVDGNDAVSSGRARAVGALLYLCRHYRDHVTGRVQEAAMGGRLPRRPASGSAAGGSEGSALAEDVASFVRLETGGGGVNSRPPSCWSVVYHCLRCGDAPAALVALETLGGDGGSSSSPSPSDPAVVEPQVAHLLSLLARRQESSGDAALFGPPPPPSSGGDGAWSGAGGGDEDERAVASARDNVAELYRRHKTRFFPTSSSTSTASSAAAPNEVARYKLASLALLSLSEPLTATAGENGVVQTIEDYLFGHLWTAVQPPRPPTPTSSSNSSPPSANEWRRWTQRQLARLGKLLHHWGPSYFEPPPTTGAAAAAVSTASPSGGWAYALPLLVAQQFGTALAHLGHQTGGAGGGAGRDGLLQATHVGIVLDLAGVSLTDLTAGGDGGGDAAAVAAAGSGETLLASLLVSHANTLQAVDPEAALEYLVRVPDVPGGGGGAAAASKDVKIGRAAKLQVQRLLLETRAFEVLAGSVSPDGRRTGGALDAHFTPSEVSTVLSDAAEGAHREGNVGDAAELLALAGRYGALLSLLNRELASLLVVEGSKDEQRRRFWYDAALRFHAAHLSQGQTHVVDVLEAEDSLQVGRTFQTMMNLMVFFDKCRANEWKDALSLIDSLQLLPTSEEQIGGQVERFHSQDVVLKQCYPQLILATMESLYEQHVALKSSPPLPPSAEAGIVGQSVAVAAGAATEQRLVELRKRARVLVTFAGLIDLNRSGDTTARIARMEAYMI